MKILGLISSPDDPASYFRIIQYQSRLKQNDAWLDYKYFFPLRDANPPKWIYQLKKITGISEWRAWDFIKKRKRLPLLKMQNSYDLIWQNRLVMPHHDFFEQNWKRPSVFDFDDAIWINEGKHFVDHAIRKASLVFAGNYFLAQYAIQLNSNVKIIPSTIDTTNYFPIKTTNDAFTIGWIGTESNHQYLEMVRPAILKFLHTYPDTRFIVISSVPPPWFTFDETRIIFKKWNRENENKLINEFSCGIIPLTDEEWTKGKCSVKMLQYMACGKPVVVSPVGTNHEILEKGITGLAAINETDWYEAFRKLKEEKDFYIHCAARAREVVETYYSTEKWSAEIYNALKSLI